MPHSSITKPMFITNVRTSGGGRDLAKGELAIVIDKSTANGAKVVSDFAGVSKKERIEIRVGRGKQPTGLRIPTVAFEGTGFFPLESIIDIKAFAPTHVELRTDRVEIGFNGMPNSKGLFIPEGKSAVMDIVIYGHPMAMFFGQKEHIITKRAFRKVGETMQEVVRRLVKELKTDSVPSTMGSFSSISDNLSNYLKFTVSDSTNVALSGTAYRTSTVKIPDLGESNDLATVQVQYPGTQITRTDRKEGVSTYSIVALTSQVIAPAVITKVDVTGKGCKNCELGYSLLEGGIVYNVQLEDNGVDKTTTVDNLPGFVLGTVLKVGQDKGTGTYSIVLTKELTQAQVNTFVALEPTAVLNSLGLVTAVCSSTSSINYTWVNGENCFASIKAFNIVVPDTECKTTRLAEIQAAYPQLVIAEGEILNEATNVVTASVGGCKRAYSTTIVTNIECVDCADVFASPFYAEAPIAFEGFVWTPVAPVFSATAKMGIVIEGKPFSLVPERYEEDEIPFVETSTKIESASFGFREQDYLNFTPAYDVNTDFAEAVKVRYAQDVNNLSQSFVGAEKMGRIHYTGETQYKNNLFARANFSQESLLGKRKRLVQYHIKYQDTSLSQMAGGRSNITHDFMIVVEQGKHQPLETILNKLTGRLGLENVSITN